MASRRPDCAEEHTVEVLHPRRLSQDEESLRRDLRECTRTIRDFIHVLGETDGRLCSCWSDEPHRHRSLLEQVLGALENLGAVGDDYPGGDCPQRQQQQQDVLPRTLTRRVTAFLRCLRDVILCVRFIRPP